jgi:hypothetical protein
LSKVVHNYLFVRYPFRYFSIVLFYWMEPKQGYLLVKLLAARKLASKDVGGGSGMQEKD